MEVRLRMIECMTLNIMVEEVSIRIIIFGNNNSSLEEVAIISEVISDLHSRGQNNCLRRLLEMRS